MGLTFTTKDEWQRWQDSRRPLHVLKDRLRRQKAAQTHAPVQLQLWRRGTHPALLVACDSTSPTNHHALLAPLASAPDLDAVIAHPAGLDLQLDPEVWEPVPDHPEALAGIDRVASIGDHLPVGAWAHAQATTRRWREWVIQHGLLTPFSPPPPPGVEFVAWSAADADYITRGRPDLTSVVTGSALLAAAAQRPAPPVSRFETPVFLGQLHGAELSRWAMTRSFTDFWRTTGALYRPHPREEDKLSRLQHAVWQRAGVVFAEATALSGMDRPVVSAFSTGILEAAVRGVPAWAHFVRPPAWLEEFWQRYEIHRWGESPTPPPTMATGNPGTTVARLLAE